MTETPYEVYMSEVSSAWHADAIIATDQQGRKRAYLSTLNEHERGDKGHLIWLKADGTRH